MQQKILLASWRSYGKIVLLVVALAYTFSFYLWTNVPDPYYWYNNTPFYSENCFECLTLWLGGCWRFVVGENVFLFRLFGWLICLVSIGIPYFALQRREEWRNNLLWLSLGLFALGGFGYNSNCLTLLTLVLLATWSIRWSRSNQVFPAVGTVAILGLISAMAVASRFPNILVIPLLGVYLLVAGYCRGGSLLRSAGVAMLYFCLSAAFTYGLLAILLGNFSVVEIIANHVRETVSDASSAHTTGGMIKGYISDLKSVFLLFASLAGIYLLRWKIKIEHRVSSVVADAVCLSMLFYVIYLSNWSIRSLIAVTIIAMAWWFRYEQSEKSHFPYYTLLFVSLAGFITCAGSNCGFANLCPYYACFLPIVAGGVSVQNLLLKHRLNIWSILVLLFWLLKWNLFSIMQFSPGGPSSATVLSYHVPSDLGHGFQLLQEEQYHTLHECMEDFERYGEKGRTIFYGISKAQYMYALTEMKPYSFLGFHMTAEARAEIEKTINVLRQHPELLLFDYTDSPLLAERLPALGYTSVRTERGTVVWKKTNEE